MELNYFLEYESVNDKLVKYKGLSCNKNYSKKIMKYVKTDLRLHLSFLITILINLFAADTRCLSL